MRAVRLIALTCVLALAACESTSTKDGVSVPASNGIVRAEIDRRIGELRYLHGNELLQSMMRLKELNEVARGQIEAGARSEDWLTRGSLAWVMGSTADRRYIPVLQRLLDDPVAGVRYEAGAALVALGDSSGFQKLVEGLGDEDIRNRYKCLESLQRATGQDFGYQHDGDPELRHAAMQRWRSWLDSLRASAL